MTLDSGATSISVTDNDLTYDTNPAVGSIVAVVPVGNFTTAINIATSNSPGITDGNLRLNSIDVTNTSGGPSTLKLIASDTGFTAPGLNLSNLALFSSFTGSISETISPGTGDTVSYQSYASPTGGVPVPHTTGAPVGPFTTTPILTHPYVPPSGTVFAISNDVPFASGPIPYSLSSEMDITLSALASANLTGNTTVAVPEPAAMSALALAGGLFLRRRRRTD